MRLRRSYIQLALQLQYGLLKKLACQTENYSLRIQFTFERILKPDRLQFYLQ